MGVVPVLSVGDQLWRTMKSRAATPMSISVPTGGGGASDRLKVSSDRRVPATSAAMRMTASTLYDHHVRCGSDGRARPARDPAAAIDRVEQSKIGLWADPNLDRGPKGMKVREASESR